MTPGRILLLLALTAQLAASQSPIHNVIVLMMENRSFDHLLGHLMASFNPSIDGLDPSTMFNRNNPTDPASPKVYAHYASIDAGPDDPHHDFDSITQHIFGFHKNASDKSSPALMDGFVANSVAAKGNTGYVMSAFNDSSLPVLSTLAKEYALFDHWHSSCPCPTNPNREFLMSATSHGYVINDFPTGGFPQETHFAFLERHNVTWKIYYSDDPWMAPAFADLRTAPRLSRVVDMPNFYSDIAAGTLPRYSLLQPRMSTSATGPSNWQHPDNSVSAGEQLIKDVYTVLRSSGYWNDTLLVITYDEHGGFFDHAPPPNVGVPSPDDMISPNGFDFSRLGVRVPTVAISPWIKAGTLVSQPSPLQKPAPTSQFESTSIISTANKMFGVSESLTRRDAWAATFEDVISGTLRSDCLVELPAVRPLSQQQIEVEMNRVLNDHHFDSLNLLCQLSRHSHPVCAQHADDASRDAFLLMMGSAAVRQQWAHAGRYPALHEHAAGRMSQQHFEAASRDMFGAYKSAVAAAAA